MAAVEAPYRRRFLALEALLVLCGLALLGLAALQLDRLGPSRSVERATPSVTRLDSTLRGLIEYHHAVAGERERLPGLFPDDAFAASLGLEIIPNAFDLRSPPSATAIFRVPLPGQAPFSPRSIEFYESGFILGRAQSFQRVTGQRGRLGLIVWAFRTPEGAQRAFRAYRDVMGIEGRAVDYAPFAGLKGDAAAGIEELFWVRGRLLIQSSWAIPQADTRAVRRAHRALTAYIDERARAGEPHGSPIRVTPDLTPLGRLAGLRVPDRVLRGGWSSVDHLGGVTADPFRGLQAAPSLDVGFSRLGLLGTHRQVIRITGLQLARFELAGQQFPDARSARRALALVERDRGGAVRAVRGIGRALEVRGPGGANYSDLWWARGRLLLRASLYSSRLAPLKPAEQRQLARLLDRQARIVLSTLPPARAAAAPSAP